MGYHDAREIPNYWAYAQQLRAPGPHVRAERVLEPARAPVHGLRVVGELHEAGDPTSCVNALQSPGSPEPGRQARRQDRDPTTPGPTSPTCCTQAHVSWGYYVFAGTQPDCADDAMTCTPKPQNAKTPGIWNPLPYFDTVHQDGQLGNIQPIENFYAAAKRDAARRLLGRPQRARSASTRPRSCRSASPTSPASSTRSCRAPTGTRPRSSWPGTTGAASTTTSSRRPSTRTATGCASPAS